jgi:hypothetical protein
LSTSIWATSKKADWSRRWVLTSTPSKLSATAESKAFEILLEPTPRSEICALAPEPPICTFNVGTRPMMSAASSMRAVSRVSELMTAAATGASSKVSCWLRAVTTISLPRVPALSADA